MWPFRERWNNGHSRYSTLLRTAPSPQPRPSELMRQPHPPTLRGPSVAPAHQDKWGQSETQLRPYQVSWLLNFFVTTLPSSRPRRSAIFWDKSWWELPLKILIFGILANYPRHSAQWSLRLPRPKPKSAQSLSTNRFALLLRHLMFPPGARL